MDNLDYRLTKYRSDELVSVLERKEEIKNRITQEHPRAKNNYTTIKNHYSNDFIRSYDERCGYCSVNLDINDSRLFEIDHFIYRKSKKFPNDKSIEANHINNLVNSCYECNRKKSSYDIDTDSEDILNPDLNQISKYFYRDKRDFLIKIDESNVEELSEVQQSTVRTFYSKVDLGNFTHSLDYLLMNMKDLLKVVDEKYGIFSNENTVLSNSINILVECRNKI